MSNQLVPWVVPTRVGTKKISAEESLLLLLARQRLEEEHELAALRLIEDQLSWDHLLELASWHRLSSFVHEQLSALAPEQIPPRLAERRFETTARNLLFQAETERLARLLHHEGIEVLLLKGMALITSVYQQAGLREMSDIDLLVPEQDIDRSNRLLQTHGYDVAPPHRDQARIEQMTREHHHYPTLLREDGQVVVELHRHVLPKKHPLIFPIDGFWERAETVSLGQESALIPGAADQVTHVALHFFLNRRYRSAGALGQLCDISEIISVHRDSMDWQLLVQYARSSNLATPLYFALTAVERLLGRSIPDWLGDQLRPAGFTDGILETFLERRVLRAEQWLPLELLRPSRHPLRRVFPAKGLLVNKEISVTRAYRRRANVAIRLFLWFLLHPRQVLRDWRLNRGLRSLYVNETR